MIADLDMLRARLGIKTTTDDAILMSSLDTARAWVAERVIDSHWPLPDVQEAVLLHASRLFKRRQSPEGISGWDDLGAVRIIASDPDIRALLEMHLDVGRTMGIG